MRVLVTGAYGNQGKKLVPKLIDAGAEVVACEFNPASEQALYEMGAKEVIIGDIRRTDVMEKAMNHIDTVYLLFPNGLANVHGLTCSMIELAEERGVKHFVLSSCMNVVPELVQHWEKYLAESELMGSNLNYTIIKPSGYMEVHFPPVAGGIFETGKITSLCKCETSSFISIDDITDAACKVIMEGEPHYFASYDLCSAGWYTSDEACELLKSCFDARGIEAEVIPPALLDWTEIPVPKHLKLVNGIISVYHGTHPYRGNTFAFDHLMGHPAKTLKQYFEECLDQFQN